MVSACSTTGGGPRVVAGRYEIGRVLGTGSSAVVYQAYDLRSGHEFAIKCFRPGASEHDLRQQRQEMAVLAHLDHLGLVRLHDGGSKDGRAYVVTDLVEGPSLAERIAVGPPLAPGAVRRLGAQLAAALAYVHAAGVVHRDVKPANVLLGRGSRPRLADFGISRVLDATTDRANGCVVGTAAYLAPEQVRGQVVGPASDVYALGLVLLEALTGRREFPGLAVESATARLYRSPAVPDGLPAGLGTVLTEMTRDDPLRRPTAQAVATALAADPTSPEASLGAMRSVPSRVVRHGRHRLGRRARPGARPVSRIALVALIGVVAMLSGAAPASPAQAPVTAVADALSPSGRTDFPYRMR
jgi:eukaryotic-like serine/threonine-protein kinase